MPQLIRSFPSVLSVLLLAAIAGCGNMQTAGGGGPAAEAPTYFVGDRWVYAAQDGFFRTVTHWQETHEVVAITPEGITVRVTVKGDTINGTRTEQWQAPGLVRIGSLVDNETRRFSTPLKRYDFPLVPGKVWNQRVNQFDETANTEAEINRYVSVGGWGSVTTPAGTFDAIKLHISMWLGDETFWRFPTSCSYLSQYSPAVRAMVHEEKECEYKEKGIGNAAIPIRSQHAAIDLVSFTPGKP
jgi:hypothetical protein